MEEPEKDDMDYLKNEIEDSFKKKADSLIDSPGMSHMKYLE